MVETHVREAQPRVRSPSLVDFARFPATLVQDVISPLQAFAEQAGLPGGKASKGSDTKTLPAANEAYVKKIKARLEAVDGECGVESVSVLSSRPCFVFDPRVQFDSSPFTYMHVPPKFHNGRKRTSCSTLEGA